MRHVSCILLLEWSTTSQRLWVYRISVPYAQKDPRFLFEKRRGQPREFWSLVSTIDGGTLPQVGVEEVLWGTLVKYLVKHTIKKKKKKNSCCIKSWSPLNCKEMSFHGLVCKRTSYRLQTMPQNDSIKRAECRSHDRKQH